MTGLYEILKAELLKNPSHAHLVETVENYHKNSLKNKKYNKEDLAKINLYLESTQDFFREKIKNILHHTEEIAINFFINLYKMHKYIDLQSYSSEYLNEFRIYSIRVIEIALYAQGYNLRFNNLFFNQKETIFYINLTQEYGIIFEGQTKKVSKKSKIDDDFKVYRNATIIIEGVQEYSFVSKVKYPYAYKNIQLSSYLRITTEAVHKVFNTLESDKKHGGGGNMDFDLDRLDAYHNEINFENKIVFFEEKSEDDINNDDIIESVAKSTKSALNTFGKLNNISDLKSEYNNYVDGTYKVTAKDLDNNNSYKKFKLNAAISHLQAKSNLDLKSSYKFPEIELLADFLHNINKKDNHNYNFLVTSIVLGIQPRTVVQIILKLSKDFELVHKNVIRVKLTTAYAQVQNFNLFNHSEKEMEFEVPIFVEQFFLEAKKIIFTKLYDLILQEETKNTLFEDSVAACKNIKDLHELMLNNFEKEVIMSIYEALVKNQQTSLSKFLNSRKKSFHKRIVITLRNLHLLTMHYYKIFHKESHVSFLFLKNKTANIHTSLTYVRATKKMTRMSLWIEELLHKFNTNAVQAQQGARILDKKYSGSNKFVSESYFKKFISLLSNIKFANDFANSTIKMIHLRYVFSILLVSRKYYFSANLKHFSKRDKFLIKHEKAKYVSSSKCIIPVTDLGCKYNEYFFKLRKQLNFESNSPVIISDTGKIYDFEKGNLSNWLDEHQEEIKEQCRSDDFELIYNFINSVPLDFGRHIFATEAYNFFELRHDYTDAMLNHFQNGTQDQGVYSLFDNQKYFHDIKKLMSKIEEKYIPFWREL